MRNLFKVSLSPRSARIETAIAALVNSTGMILELSLGRDIPGMPDWPAWLSAGAGVVIILILFMIRTSPNPRVIATLFLCNTLFVVLALYLRDPYFAKSGVWIPFQENKLGGLIVALLAPSFWVGLAGIGAHVACSLLQYQNFPPEIKSGVAIDEPLATFGFGLAALFIFVSRWRRIQCEADVIRSNSEASASRNIARMVLHLRDLMNTPLQTISLSTYMLREKSGSDEIAIKSIENALERLTELNDEMQKYEDNPPWKTDS